MKKVDQSRRRTLKTLGFGGGLGAAGFVLPQNWSRPVVESVVLPAHAQTTVSLDDVTGTFQDEGIATIVGRTDPSIMDMLIPTAHASSFTMADVCMDIVNSIADVYVDFSEYVGSPNLVIGLQAVSVPFGYTPLIYQSDDRWAINAQFQQAGGDIVVVGNIREDLNWNNADPPEYAYYPYTARPGSGGCNLTLTPQEA